MLNLDSISQYVPSHIHQESDVSMHVDPHPEVEGGELSETATDIIIEASSGSVLGRRARRVEACCGLERGLAM